MTSTVVQEQCLECGRSTGTPKSAHSHPEAGALPEWDYRLSRRRRPNSKRRSYDEFMRSTRWRRLRKQAIERARFVCQRCASPSSLEVHHLRYPENIEETAVSDLQVVCSDCHRLEHREKW